MRTRLLPVLATSLIVLGLLSSGAASASGNPVICAASSPPAAALAPAAPATTVVAQPGQAYLHTSTASSIGVDVCVTDSTFLENPALNGQPGMRLLVTSNGLPYHDGVLPTGKLLGVWYDTFVQRWAIYNEDQSSMDPLQAWNVFIPPQDSTLIVHASSAGNSAGPLTRISDPQFNGQPNAVIFVQHVFNPGTLAAAGPQGGIGNYYTHTVAVTYDAGVGQWAIRNADGSSFPPHITFFALVASSDETAFTHTTTLGNIAGLYATILDNPLLNGNPDAQVLVTQNYGAGVANNHEVAAAYNSVVKHWLIYNQDTAAMPVGARFNVLVIPPKHGAFVQTASFANTLGNAITLDHPDLNNNPDALVYVTHNYNPPDAVAAHYDDHPIGVSYAAGRWHIENVDGAGMVIGTAFNVTYTWPRGNSFSASASATNSSGAVLTLNNPLLNSAPGAPAIATFNHTPAGLPGGVYTPTIGLRYNNAVSATQVFNPGGPTFVISQTYNILVPLTNTFVVTATFAAAAPNFVPNSFTLDNPLTNGQPWALLFVTPVDNSGINHHNLGVYYLAGPQKWAIFNEDSLPMDPNTVYNVFVVQRHGLWLPAVRR